jgi:Raf kinase inhibitor-like YbhB/YbcL family protein
MAFKLTLNAFPEGGVIPSAYTCEGEDKSPALSWSDEPPGTKSFAVIVDDPDAPSGTFTHWLLYDIPSSVHSLPEESSSNEGISGKNDFGRTGYNGPCPPEGHGPHRYYFKVFAVDVPSLGLRAGAKRADVDRALRNHVLAEAQHMGRYERGQPRRRAAG